MAASRNFFHIHQQPPSADSPGRVHPFCPGPPLWSCSAPPPQDLGTQLINGKRLQYSRPAGACSLASHVGASYPHCLPCLPPHYAGAKTTNGLQSNAVSYDWQGCCVSGGHIVYPHKAVLQCIVREKPWTRVYPLVVICLRSRTSSCFIRAQFVCAASCLTAQRLVLITSVIRCCLHFSERLEIFPLWHPVDRLSIFSQHAAK